MEPFCCSPDLNLTFFYTNPMTLDQQNKLTKLDDHCKDMFIQAFVLAN